jgi:hypothetical protein
MSCLRPPSVAEHLQFFLAKRADVPRDATSDDKSNLDECEGWLSKLSQRGAWQSRFFYLNNAYLVYTSKKGAPPLASIDLSKVRAPLLLPRRRCACARARTVVGSAPPPAKRRPGAPRPTPPPPPLPALSPPARPPPSRPRSASPLSWWTLARASSSW